MLGNESIGSSFLKKFLLKPHIGTVSTKVPINLPVNDYFEESYVVETFLKLPDDNGANDKRIIE